MSNNLDIIKTWIKVLSNEQIDKICDLIVNKNDNLDSELNKIVDNKTTNQIIELVNLSYFNKSMEIATWLDEELINHKFYYISDWKDKYKVNLTKILISLEYVTYEILKNILGFESKKTYENGEVIDDNSLSLCKFFDSKYKQVSDKFYEDLDIIRKDISLNDIDFELVRVVTKQMVELIQCEIVCRNKYELGELEIYKSKMIDITNTRLTEERFFQLLNKVRFYNLVNEPGNEALKSLLFGTWDDTKGRYYWLTQLVTYKNNYNSEVKQYLKNACGVPDSLLKDKKSVGNVIKTVVKNVGLNMKNIRSITTFVFEIGNYFKHGTYFKWYNKELEYINLFDKYIDKSFDVNLSCLVEKLECDLDSEPIKKLTNLIIEYKNYMENNFV